VIMREAMLEAVLKKHALLYIGLQAIDSPKRRIPARREWFSKVHYKSGVAFLSLGTVRDQLSRAEGCRGPHSPLCSEAAAVHVHSGVAACHLLQSLYHNTNSMALGILEVRSSRPVPGE